ncbi:hypothetical protein IGI04_013149 [Brassica rapa subsp. trilocularis]|uniref:DUF4283 domain-containing protein n=1 Tax=Brassica rapa subsp. trilocularis TaxID=1813537 RepID=A0ABQ7N812_BRACM|nr:hypothetical protein IGI04_013149 [Brassica rapa subsp. trilocularis]
MMNKKTIVPARGPTFVNPSSPSQCSLLDSIPGSSPAPPPHTSSAPYSSPSTDSVPQTWADKAKLSTDKSLKRMSTTSTSLSPEGIPRVSIPDEVFQRGALLHKDFIVGRFFGRVPSFKTIQNVLNYLWGKGNRLEIHLIQATRSMLVRIPSDFIREKVLKKRIWYVDTAMFHVAQWSDGDVADTSLLESIQIWAHLKGVPFDLMTNEGLSWITDAIGFPKEMDDWTKNLQSLSVAHVKVEVDATKPLPSVLELVRKSGATFRVDVEYPWLPPTCSHCKQLGHIIKDCLKITRKWVPIQREKDPEKNANSSLPVLATVFEPALVNPTPPTDVPSSSSGPALPSSPYQIISFGSGLELPSPLAHPTSIFPPSIPVVMDIDTPPDLSSFPPLPSSIPPSSPSPPLPHSNHLVPPSSPPSPVSSYPQNYVLALAATVMPISSIPPPPKPLLLPPLTQPPPSSPPSSPVVAVSSQFPPPSYSFRTFHAKKPDWESPKRKYKLSSKPPLISPENQIDYSNPFAPLSNLSLSNPQSALDQSIMCTKMFFWNVRGINDTDKHRPFAQWLSVYQPFIGALLETHIKETNLNQIMATLCPGWNYLSNHNTDEDGRVIIIWKPSVTVQEIHQTRQSITCKVGLQTGQSFFFSAIYASNEREERLDLWNGLLEVQQTYYLEDRSWIIGGDLNQITHFAEHSSPNVDHLTADMLELKDFLLDLGVEDLRFQGNAHTWTNKRPENPITKKLDRALVNNNWISSFPSSVATFLAHEFSDHSPCLIDTACPLPSSGTKRFKFFNHLTSHPTFTSSVEAEWALAGSKAYDLSSLGFKLKSLKRPLKSLHKENFSDIQKRAKEQGGLGLRNLEGWNAACAIKMIWLIFFAEGSIWASWFIQEMLQGNLQLFWVINTRQKHSWLVKKLLEFRPLVFSWFRQRVGNGETCYFWSGNWSPFGKLSDFLETSGSLRYPIPKEATLAELWENGAWILPNARSDKQVEVISYLSTLALNDNVDTLEWWPGNQPHMRFSTVPWYKEVWFSGGIPKHKFLTWLMIRNRCPTRDRLLTWGLQTDPQCLFCNSADESIAHSEKCRFRTTSHWNSILAQLQSTALNKHQRSLLLLGWQATLYILWSERNNRLHRAQFSSSDGIQKKITLTVKNRISSLRSDRPAFSSALMQLWFFT